MDVSKGLTFSEARKIVSNTLSDILSSAAIPDANGRIHAQTKHICFQAFLAVILYVIAIALAGSSLRAEAVAAVVAIVVMVIVDACVLFMYHKSEAVEVHSALRLILAAYDTYCGETHYAIGSEGPPGGDLTYLTSGHSQVSIVHTYRDGRWQRIPILLLAEGDIIALMGGDITPGRCCEIERVSLLPAPPTHGASVLSPTDHRSETRWQLGRTMQAGEKVLIRNRRYFSQQSPVRVFEEAERAAAEAEDGAGAKANSGAEHPADDGHAQPLHNHYPGECQLHDEDAEHMTPPDYVAPPHAHPHPSAQAQEPSHPDLDYGNRHRTLGAESVEILSLSGDVRCFRMSETPVASFVRQVALRQAEPMPTGGNVDAAGLRDAQCRDYAALGSQSPDQTAQATSLIRKLFQALVVETGFKVLLLVTIATAAGMAARYVASHFRGGSGGVEDRVGWADHVLVPTATACVFFLPLALPLCLVLAEACATADVLASAEVTLGHAALYKDQHGVVGTSAHDGQVQTVEDPRRRRAVSSTSDDLTGGDAAGASSSGAGGGVGAEEESLSDQFVDEDLDDRAEDMADEVHTQVTWLRYLAYLRRVLWHRLLLHWHYSAAVKAGAGSGGGTGLAEADESFYLPVPLARSRLLEVLGAVTMVCFVDDDVICEGYSVTEEIFLLMDDHQSNRAAGEATGKASNKGCPVPPGLEDMTDGAKETGGKQSQSNVKGVVLDLHANPEATGSRFENPQWWRYLPSLKPLGLNAMLTYSYGAAAATLSNSTPEAPGDRVQPAHAGHLSAGGGGPGAVRSEGRLARSGREPLSPQAQAQVLSQSMYVISTSMEQQSLGHAQPASAAHARHSPRSSKAAIAGSSPSQSPHHHHHHHHHHHSHGNQEQHQLQQQQQQHTDRSLVRHIRHLLPQEALRELAEEIGFEQSDLTAFSRVLEVNVLAPGLENAHLLEDTHQWGQEESRRRGSLLPQLRGGVYRDFRDGSLQMMCLGDPSLVLNYCREYWDGGTRSITPLSSGDRAEVLQVYERWRLEDFEVVAFCYSPLPTASLNPLVSPKDDPSATGALQTPSAGVTRRGSASMSADQVGRASFSFSGKQQQQQAGPSPLGCVPFAASKHSTLFFVDPITTAELQRVAAGIAGKARNASQGKAGHKSAGQAHQPAYVPKEEGSSMARSSTVPAALPSGSNAAAAISGEQTDENCDGGGLMRAATVDPKCLPKSSLVDSLASRGGVVRDVADNMPHNRAEATRAQGSPEMALRASSEKPLVRGTSRSDAANLAQGSPARPRGASNGNLVKSVSLDDVPQFSHGAGALSGDLAAVRLDGLYGADTTVSSPGIAPTEDMPSPIRVSTSAKDFRESKHLLPRLGRRVLIPQAEPSPHLSFPDDDETATVTSDVSPSVSETPIDAVRATGAGIADIQLLDGANSDDGRSFTPPPKPIKRSVSQSGMVAQSSVVSFDDSMVGRSESKLFPSARATSPPMPRVRAAEQRRSGGDSHGHGRAGSPSLRKHASEFVHPVFVSARFTEQRGLTAKQRLQQEQQRAQQHARQLRRASTRQLWSLMRQQVFLGMAASSVPVRRDVPNIKEDLDSAGVRFVYFSAQNMKRSKPVAEKIGIPFDWNCAISLRELDDATGHDPHRHISNYADWDVLARMPHGIEAIKGHLETVDNVPLLVSLFTDATPLSVKQMVEVFRDNGEVVLAIGGGYRSHNQSIYSTADLGCSVCVLPGLSDLSVLPADEEAVVRQFPVRSATSLCRADILLSFRLIGLNTTNFLQTPCLSSVCRDQATAPGAAPVPASGVIREEGSQPGPAVNPADLEHLRLGVLTETLRKGRILLLNMLQALAFYCIATLSLGLWPLVSLAVPMSLPPSPSPGVALLFVCVHVPLLCLVLLLCGEPEGVMKHAPRKNALQQRPRDMQRFLSYLAVRCACVLGSVVLVGWLAAASTMRGSRSLLSSMGRFHFLDLDSAADRSALWLVRDVMSAQAVLSLVAQACTLTVRGQSRLVQFPWPWRFPEAFFYVAGAAVVGIHTGVLALRSALRDGSAFGHDYVSLDWPVWLLMAVLPAVGVLVGVLSNRDDERHHKRYLQFLRLEFDTRLGMHSPR